MDPVQAATAICIIGAGGYTIGKVLEFIYDRARGPLCSCGHPAAQHSVPCLEEGCKCLAWKHPNKE
jgi:hypothetical protein